LFVYGMLPLHHLVLSEGKAVLVIGHRGPWGCETSRLTLFIDTRLTDGGEVSVTLLPLFTPQQDSWDSFLLEAESISGP
jgi:hypothetical protein